MPIITFLRLEFLGICFTSLVHPAEHDPGVQGCSCFVDSDASTAQSRVDPFGSQECLKHEWVTALCSFQKLVWVLLPQPLGLPVERR